MEPRQTEKALLLYNAIKIYYTFDILEWNDIFKSQKPPIMSISDLRQWRYSVQDKINEVKEEYKLSEKEAKYVVLASLAGDYIGENNFNENTKLGIYAFLRRILDVNENEVDLIVNKVEVIDNQKTQREERTPTPKRQREERRDPTPLPKRRQRRESSINADEMRAEMERIRKKIDTLIANQSNRPQLPQPQPQSFDIQLGLPISPSPPHSSMSIDEPQPQPQPQPQQVQPLQPQQQQVQALQTQQQVQPLQAQQQVQPQIPQISEEENNDESEADNPFHDESYIKLKELVEKGFSIEKKDIPIPQYDPNIKLDEKVNYMFQCNWSLDDMEILHEVYNDEVIEEEEKASVLMISDLILTWNRQINNF